MFQVLRVFPAPLQDDRDHRLDQQGVGPGPQRQVDIGEPRGFALPRVDDHQQFVGMGGDPSQHPGGLGHLVAPHPVPAPADQHLGFMLIGNGEIVLLAQHPPVDPPGAAELLAGGGVEVLRAQRAEQGQAEGGFEMAALGAGAHVGQTS